MRRFLFFCSFCFLSIFNQAQQTFNVAYHDKSEQATGCLLSVFNDYYFATYKLDADGFGTSYLYRYSNAGILKMRQSAMGWNNPPLGWSTPKKVVGTSDNKLLFVGGARICDIAGPDMTSFVWKVDTNGTLLFTSTLTTVFGDYFNHVIEYSDSTFCVFTDSLMFRFNENGVFINKKNLNLRSISAVKLLQNDRILLSANNGTFNALIEIDTSGSILNTYQNALLYNKIEFYGGNKLMLSSGGNLYKYSPSYNGISSTIASSGIKDFVVFYDSVYVVGDQDYFACDSSFHTITSSFCTTQSVTQQAILKSGNLVSVLSTCISKNSPSFPGEHMSVTLNVFDKLASNNFENDMAILSVEVDSSYGTRILTSLINGSVTSYASYIWLKAKVNVKNKSTRPLQSFKLNCYESMAMCGSFFYQEQFNISPLPFGDSVTVTTAFFKKYHPGTYQVGDSTLVNFCLFSTVPNNSTDKVLSDNELCKNVNTKIIVGLREQQITAIDLMMYPNPSIGEISFKSDQILQKIEIVDVSGRQVFIANPLGNNFDLNISTLPSGLYFVKASSENGSVTKKLVKQ